MPATEQATAYRNSIELQALSVSLIEQSKNVQFPSCDAVDAKVLLSSSPHSGITDTDYREQRLGRGGRRLGRRRVAARVADETRLVRQLAFPKLCVDMCLLLLGFPHGCLHAGKVAKLASQKTVWTR
ncbi:hypothetical protein BaRGS_00011916 [Batillaria attramentaria]|uniref:Uncharacterized protein n=1 Tax=Batillaria attramentaria TaxID=370345 RepID=A0ABD0LCR7_9CAEN